MVGVRGKDVGGLVVGVRGGRGQGSRWWGLTPTTPRPHTPLDPGSRGWGLGVKGSKGGRSQG